ncbi:hypothetical protein BHE97_00525 [Aeromicrobium sp. PE09-221]|uniref:DUF2079 domain-containing protein n=1 Tax=Aeromicrobium sp. PE09-221 TaxID=1898043 RepID=UPI000B3E7B9D|nr:DUF2079 domain-containing protein [Aeromicrobium sp. PE09-221]OUZ12731.1 hypothetical protein BHE97_00525 [Aeromicrobium sp. PE09-221]
MDRRPAWILGIVTALVYSVLGVLRFRRFTVTSWDNAIFEQALAAYARFEAPIVTVKGPDYHILGDHFSPIYAILAPVYRVFPHAQTLLVAQAVLIGLSVVVITGLAVRHLGSLAGTIVGVLYAVSFGVQSAVVADFHEVAFAVPLLALAGAAFVEARYDRVVWWSLPLLLVKEDMGFTVAAVGAALWLAGERRKGVTLGLVGMAAVAIVVGIVIPSFNAGDGYDYAGTLGGESGILATLAADPGRKLLTLALTFAIAGVVALLSPWALLVVPTFAWRFVGDNPFYWGTEWHYSLIVMPVVFVAMVDVVARRHRLMWPALVLGGAATVYTLIGSPLTTLVDPETWRESPRAEAAEGAIDLLPRGATVESDLGLLTHLATDYDLYWRGTVGAVVPDYIVFDSAISPEDIEEYGRKAHGTDYTVVYDEGGYTVARRGA